MSEARPFTKEQQLARGERRYSRKVASAKQWQKIIAEKRGPCRICGAPGTDGSYAGRITFHHIIPRSLGGDDIPDNIAPVCWGCHDDLERGIPTARHRFCAALTDSEYAYIVEKMGEDFLGRVYGVFSCVVDESAGLRDA